MYAVITGDIINSRSTPPSQWLDPLKELLNQHGKNPKSWEIFRGDSFQLLLDAPLEALKTAIQIKSRIKTIKGLDVRMSIGVGNVDYHAKRITEANGDAFIYSGETFESLKEEKLTLAIRTPWEELNTEFNLNIRLVLIAMDNWTEASARLVSLKLNNEMLKQSDIAQELGISQSSVSERQKRAHYDEIMMFEARYRERLTTRMES